MHEAPNMPVIYDPDPRNDTSVVASLSACWSRDLLVQDMQGDSFDLTNLRE